MQGPAPREGDQPTPLISVITPFYNRARYLQQVVDTVAGQTFKDAELVIVDDGSTDDFSAAVHDLKSTIPLRPVRLHRNVGAASARNVGLDHAAGRFVAFLDSDDSWAPDKLEKQLQHLLGAGDQGDLVSITRQLVLGRHVYVAPRQLMTPRASVGAYLFQAGGIIQSSMMFLATDLAKSVRFVDGGRGHDDWSFALRLQRAGARFDMLPQPLTIYDDRQGRVRRSPAHSSARFEWLEQWRAELGEPAYFAARANFASQMDRRSVATLHYIRAAVSRGAIPHWRAAYYAARWAIPSLGSLGAWARTGWLCLSRPRAHRELIARPRLLRQQPNDFR
jgi:glycosyltransferase involved in cell wall biosynthesis